VVTAIRRTCHTAQEWHGGAVPGHSPTISPSRVRLFRSRKGTSHPTRSVIALRSTASDGNHVRFHAASARAGQRRAEPIPQLPEPARRARAL